MARLLLVKVSAAQTITINMIDPTTKTKQFISLFCKFLENQSIYYVGFEFETYKLKPQTIKLVQTSNENIYFFIYSIEFFFK